MSNSFGTPRTVACQAPLSVGFPRQEYWRGLPFPSPGDLLYLGTEPAFSALVGGFFTANHLGSLPLHISSVQFSRSVVSDSLQPHEPQLARPPVPHQLLEPTQTHVHYVGDAIQPSHPLSFPSPPALNLSQHWVFSNESALCIRSPKYWSFRFNISPFNEHPKLISFRMDWLDLLAVQGTL